MPTKTRMKLRATSAAGVIAALAIAAPATAASAASAATPPPPPRELPALPALGGGFPALDGFGGVPLSFVGPSVGFVASAIGPTVIGSVFNGGTSVVVSTSPAAGSVIGSP
jgi:hypothetical protein